MRRRCSAPTDRRRARAGRLGGVSRLQEPYAAAPIVPGAPAPTVQGLAGLLIPTVPGRPAVQAVLQDGLACGPLLERGRTRVSTASGDGPRSTRRPARPADRHPAAVGRRRALRQALGHRIPGGVPLLVRPVDRRHQLAGRAGHPPRGGHDARCAAATAPAAGPTLNRCWPASCVPPANATSTRRSLITTMLAPPNPSCLRDLALPAARLTPGGVETKRSPLPDLLRASGPHSIRAVPPPPEPPTRGFRRQRRERHQAARRCSRRRSPLA